MQRLCARCSLRLVCRRGCKKVLGIDEPATGLPKTLRRLLLTEAEHVDALLADAGGKPGEIAVGGNQAEAVETTTVKKIHRVDDQSDVGRVLACRIGELLLRNDRVPR